MEILFRDSTTVTGTLNGTPLMLVHMMDMLYPRATKIRSSYCCNFQHTLSFGVKLFACDDLPVYSIDKFIHYPVHLAPHACR